MRLLDTALEWFAKAALRLRSAPPSRGVRTMADLMLGAGSTSWPGAWSQDRIEQSRHFRLWPYIAIKCIAEEVAGNPPRFGIRRHPQEAKRLRSVGKNILSRRQRLKTFAPIQSHEELELLDFDHALCQLFHQPNQFDVAWNFWFETIMFGEISGNIYWWKVLNKAGRICELWVMPSHWVWPVSAPGRMVDYYEVRPYGFPGASKTFYFAADEIVAFRYPGTISKIDGWAPMTAGAEWIDTDESVMACRYFTFKNQARPDFVIEMDKTMIDPTQQKVDQFYALWDGKLRGEANRGRPAVLSPGMSAKELGHSPAELEYITGADQQRDMILALWRVTKSIAGIDNDMNFASMGASSANFLHRTVGPKLKFIDQVGTRDVAQTFDPKLVMFHDDLAPEDPEQKREDLEVQGRLGAVTPNEVRQEYGREPYKRGGDDPLVPMTLSVLPINTGEDLDEDLAARAGTGEAEEQPGEGGPGEGASGLPDVPDFGGKKRVVRAPALANGKPRGKNW